jgi:hypothetical protein
MEAPSPNQIIKPFNLIIKNNDIDYNIIIDFKNEQIIISIEEENIIPPKIYEQSYSKNDLEKISKIFKMFDNNFEAFNKICELFNNKNYNQIINEDKIIFGFKNEFTEFSFDIPIKGNNNSNYLINNLYKIIKELKQENEKDKTSITNLKNENLELKYIINTIITQNRKFEEKLSNLQKENKEIKEKIKQLKNQIEKTENENNQNNELKNSTILNNKEEINLISNYIKENTKINFKLLYKLSKDGDLIKTFHEKCDNKGPTLIIIKTTKGFRFGGFNPITWDISGDYKISNSVFIFSLDKKKKYLLNNGHDKFAICGSSTKIAFGGGHDISILDQCSKNINNYTYPYSFNTTEKFELNGGEKNFIVSDMEVYLVLF